MQRTLPVNWRITDALIALALAVVGALMAYATVVAGLQMDQSADWRWVMLSAVILAAPVAFYRRYPVPIAIVVTGLYIACAYTTGIEIYTAQVSLYLTFYAIGAWEGDRRLALRVRVGIIAVMATWLLIVTVGGFTSAEAGEMGVSAYFAFLFIQWMINIAFYGAGWVFGQRAWDSARERQELLAAHEKISAQQEVIAQNAVEAERFRIARELHDTVAHHVTVMGVQAAAARRLLPGSAPGVAEQLRGVEGSSRQAVEELRTMVHTLRDSTIESQPLPTIGDLQDLTHQARATGQQVTLETIGEEDGLSPAVELTAYRVVQEALSNARKHAGPRAITTVTVRHLPDSVEVDIVDNGWGETRRATAEAGTGTGLVGMRERVQALGGTLDAGATSRGGWLVRAIIPSRPRGNEEQGDDIGG